MTQQQLERSVAETTGESIRVIRDRGFSLLSLPEAYPVETENRVVTCPLCRRDVPATGMASDGSSSMAECLDCDLYFEPKPVVSQR